MKGRNSTTRLSMFCYSCQRYLALILFPEFSDSRDAICTPCGRVPKKHTYRRDHKDRVRQIYLEHKKCQEVLSYTLRELRHFCLVVHLKIFSQYYEIWRLSTGILALKPTVVRKDEKIPFTLTNLIVTRVGASKLLWPDSH